MRTRACLLKSRLRRTFVVTGAVLLTIDAWSLPYSATERSTVGVAMSRVFGKRHGTQSPLQHRFVVQPECPTNRLVACFAPSDTETYKGGSDVAFVDYVRTLNTSGIWALTVRQVNHQWAIRSNMIPGASDGQVLASIVELLHSEQTGEDEWITGAAAAIRGPSTRIEYLWRGFCHNIIAMSVALVALCCGYYELRYWRDSARRRRRASKQCCIACGYALPYDSRIRQCPECGRVAR
jgi:hypothetical protein